MNWSVPAAVKWIRALEPFDLQFVEQPVPDFDLRGLAQVRRAVATPIAADEACTTLRSALELIKADACDVFVVYPSEAGGLTRAPQIAARRGRGRQVVRDRQLGRARRRHDGERARRRGVARTSRSRATPTIHCSCDDVLDRCGGDRATASITVSREPGLGVTLDAGRASRSSRGLELRESPFYDEIKGDAPSVGQIFYVRSPRRGGTATCAKDKATREQALSSARSAGATC